ncbi:MAG: S8 family serine peptidase [Saprospiraceae bacterium]
MAKKLNKATFNYGGAPLSLTKSTTQAAVRFNPSTKPTGRAARSLASGPELESFQVVTAKRGIDAKLDKMRALPEVSAGTHVYHFDDQDDAPFVPTGNLYIEFAPDADGEQQQSVLDALGLSIKELVAPGAMRVSVTADSPNPIKCAMTLQKNKLVRVAEPEFLTLPSERDFAPPTGRFVATQWHHENTGAAIPIFEIPNAVYGSDHFKKGADAKIKAAWQFIGGLGDKNLKIAVIDTGFATEHPQLRGDGTKIRTPFNAAARSSDVSPLVRYSDGSLGVMSHGTSCAAVAAGAWDVNGILGACPNARIIPIKLDILSDEAIKNAFEHAFLNGADIISCSLGFPKPVPLSTYVSNYLKKIAREGRGGKGLPMFFAAGNANPNSNNLPRPVSDFANHPDVLCVTASNSLDQSSDYTFYGPNAFLCAPTNGDPGIGITTATAGIAGDGVRVELGYTSGFGGTSSATPLAAGVCALMLTANPALTLDQIRDILKKSADKIGGASSYDASGHSDYFGFGRLNALNAVKLANALLSGGQAPAPTPTPPPATKQRGRVISKFLNVRSGPATSNAKVAELKQGDVVDLLEKTGGWWRIGTKRFVSADYIQILPTTRTAKVINSFLNVRSGPGVGNPKVGELKLGDVVSVLETTADGWFRIGEKRWVLGKYTQLI